VQQGLHSPPNIEDDLPAPTSMPDILDLMKAEVNRDQLELVLSRLR
jgi:hypothetical protein